MKRENPFVMRVLTLAIAASVWSVAAQAAPGDHEKVRIAVGRGEVLVSAEDVRTVAIAEPKIADAAVGSQKTVVVNAKSPGTTTLVVYNEGARYRVYDVEVYVPNGDKQIALHSTIAEVTEDARKQLGFDWDVQATSTVPWFDGSAEGGLFPTKTAPGVRDGFLSYVRTKGDLALAAQWEALKQNGDLRELANPTLVAKSGGQASFLSGGEFPVPIATSGGTANGIAQQTVTIEWKQFGVKLNFTPTVMEDGRILLMVETEVSRLDFTNSVKLGGFELPALDTRRAKTEVILQPNEFLVIGGLKQSETIRLVRKVPILGEIPLFGMFFKSTRTQKVEKDLLAVISPEVVSAGNAMPALPTDSPMPSEPGKK